MAQINKPSQPLVPPTDIEDVEGIVNEAIASDTTHAPLVNDLVPAVNLPSYVDDVLEFDSVESFPDPGEEGKIYVAIDTNYTYRWAGSVYTQVGGSEVDLSDYYRKEEVNGLLDEKADAMLRVSLIIDEQTKQRITGHIDDEDVALLLENPERPVCFDLMGLTLFPQLVQAGDGLQYTVMAGSPEGTAFVSIIVSEESNSWEAVQAYGIDTLTNGLVEAQDNIAELQDNKQETLVSGENIKTINGESILSSGDIVIESGDPLYIELQLGDDLPEEIDIENCHGTISSEAYEAILENKGHKNLIFKLSHNIGFAPTHIDYNNPMVFDAIFPASDGENNCVFKLTIKRLVGSGFVSSWSTHIEPAEIVVDLNIETVEDMFIGGSIPESKGAQLIRNNNRPVCFRILQDGGLITYIRPTILKKSGNRRYTDTLMDGNDTQIFNAEVGYGSDEMGTYYGNWSLSTIPYVTPDSVQSMIDAAIGDVLNTDF